MGHHLSEETKRKLSEANSGANHYNYGKHQLSRGRRAKEAVKCQ